MEIRKLSENFKHSGMSFLKGEIAVINEDTIIFLPKNSEVLEADKCSKSRELLEKIENNSWEVGINDYSREMD